MKQAKKHKRYFYDPEKDPFVLLARKRSEEWLAKNKERIKEWFGLSPHLPSEWEDK